MEAIREPVLKPEPESDAGVPEGAVGLKVGLTRRTK